MKPKWVERRRRDQRGLEIQHLVPDMLQYVSERYEPLVQYCITPSDHIKYSLPSLPLNEAPTIDDIKAFSQEAKRDMAMYDSPAMENTYHTWEKKNSERKSFSSEVVRLVAERFKKTSDFYRAANIDKRTFHKIRSDYGYQPSRITAFRCCIGLGLSVEEAENLLKLAGMAFSPNNADDLVVKFCLEKGIHDIPGINYMLYRYATRPLTDNKKETGADEFYQHALKEIKKENG